MATQIRINKIKKSRIEGKIKVRAAWKIISGIINFSHLDFNLFNHIRK